MEAQLRIYKIEDGRLDDWVSEWRQHLPGLRRRFGFDVRGAWVSREENNFVWLLVYQGEGTWPEADAAYYASAERAAVVPDPARLVVHAVHLDVRPVDF